MGSEGSFLEGTPIKPVIQLWRQCRSIPGFRYGQTFGGGGKNNVSVPWIEFMSTYMLLGVNMSFRCILYKGDNSGLRWVKLSNSHDNGRYADLKF